MTVEKLLYALFKRAPRTLFQLTQVEVDGQYQFQNDDAALKEGRNEGFFRSVDDIGPNIFLKIQASCDPTVYWNIFQRVCTYYKQTDSPDPFIVIVLFLDLSYDPDDSPFSCRLPHQFVRANLLDCLAPFDHLPGFLTVLKPLVLAERETLPNMMLEWKAEIYSLQLAESTERALFEMLEYAIIHRFPQIARKELEKNMSEFPPIQETAIGCELLELGRREGMQIGLEKGRKEGFEEGRQKGAKIGERKGIRKGGVIGQILMAQRVLKRPLSSEQELSRKHVQDLKAILQRLEAELKLEGE